MVYFYFSKFQNKILLLRFFSYYGFFLNDSMSKTNMFCYYYFDGLLNYFFFVFYIIPFLYFYNFYKFSFINFFFFFYYYLYLFSYFNDQSKCFFFNSTIFYFDKFAIYFIYIYTFWMTNHLYMLDLLFCSMLFFIYMYSIYSVL